MLGNVDPGERVTEPAPEPRRLETTLHDLTNSLAAARSYAEVLRNRSRIGALHHPEPVIDYLVDELDRLTGLARDVRKTAHGESEASLAWAFEEIFEPARDAEAMLEVVEAAAESGRPLDEVRDLAEQARRHVARIRGLAEHIQDRRANLQDVDPDEILDAVLAGEAGRLLQERSALVARDPLPPARADPQALRQVLDALVRNAVQHNPGALPEVEIGGRILPDGAREFWVRDNGPGLPGGFAAASPRSGLTRTQRAVETMGGRAWAETPPLGDGTVIRFVLPAPRRAPAAGGRKG